MSKIKGTNEELLIAQLLRLDLDGNPTDTLDPVEDLLLHVMYGFTTPFPVLEALQFYAKLKAKDLDGRRCMYCGGSVPDTNEAMLEHIFSCEKRPEKTLLAKAFETENGLFSKIMHLTAHDYKPLYCDECKEIKEAIDAFYMLEETNGRD